METRRKSSRLAGLVVLVGLGLAAVWGWFAVTDPWIYTVGGTRLWPLWEGKATAQGPGGAYTIYVGFYPSTGPQVRPATWVNGFAYICAPDGTSHYANLGGSAPGVIWKEMNGAPFHLYLRGPTNFKHMMAEARLIPSVDFYGRWDGQRLVMQDDGTLTASFLPDAANPKSPITIPSANQTVTFEESLWGWLSPCH